MLLYFSNVFALFVISLSEGGTRADPLPKVTLITPGKPIEKGYSDH